MTLSLLPKRFQRKCLRLLKVQISGACRQFNLNVLKEDEFSMLIIILLVIISFLPNVFQSIKTMTTYDLSLFVTIISNCWWQYLIFRNNIICVNMFLKYFWHIIALSNRNHKGQGITSKQVHMSSDVFMIILSGSVRCSLHTVSNRSVCYIFTDWCCADSFLDLVISRVI